MPKPNKTKNLKVAFVADPIEKFDTKNETSFFIMHELSKRGFDSYHFELKDLFIKNTTPHALLKKIHVTKKNSIFKFKVLENKIQNLNQMHAIFLRKDPPVDINFIDHLSILELVSKKVLMVNHPMWVKHANEKLFPLHFNDITPRSIVSQANNLIREFVNKEKIAILKPLNQAGGRGIIKVNSHDTSLDSIIDVSTAGQTRYIMAQQYLPASKKGDKRILILDGKILGSFLRIPPKNDFRGNLHSGAKLVKSGVTKRDKYIVDTIKDRLTDLGLFFVGIDIIDKYCTEINSTSPMGIREINQTNNSHIEKTVVDWILNKIPISK